MIVKRLASILKSVLKTPFYRLYLKRLTDAAQTWQLPQHIGIILDGNRRYARTLGLAGFMAGHDRGADKLSDVLRWCFQLNIPVVTIWIFSLDNFNRDQDEVEGLLKLIEAKTRDYILRPDLHENRVKVKYIGRTKLLPESLQNAIGEMEEKTASYERHVLNIAIAYGGREEITDACRDFLTEQIEAGRPIDELLAELKPEAIDSFMYTSGLPDPDLIIRTSGEVRLSGFLLWQSAYSEYYFCDTYWPEFRKIDLLRAIRSYHFRGRRYGR